MNTVAYYKLVKIAEEIDIEKVALGKSEPLLGISHLITENARFNLNVIKKEERKNK